MRLVAHKSEAGDAVMEMLCELNSLLNGSLQHLTSIDCNVLK